MAVFMTDNDAVPATNICQELVMLCVCWSMAAAAPEVVGQRMYRAPWAAYRR